MQLYPPSRLANGLTRSGFDLLIEASMLGLKPGWSFDRLYDDACDEGLVLRSHKGNETRWYHADTKTNDGDVVEWSLRPCTESVHQFPALLGYTLRVLND